MTPTVTPGDTVNFVNNGHVTSATVTRVNDDGSVSLYYQPPDYAAKVNVHDIPWCPPGGSHGWQKPDAPAEADAAAAVEDATGA